MRLVDGRLVISATDIAHHFGCRYLTQLDREAAEGRLKQARLAGAALKRACAAGLRLSRLFV